MLSRLVALNAERAREEARGHVRWLRPDYQIPKLGHKVRRPEEQIEADVAVAVAAESAPWPAEEREQFSAVRALIDAAAEPISTEAVARAFKGRLSPQRKQRVEEVLGVLADLGIVRSGQREGTTLYFTRR